jgi:hypothetical protein
MSYSHSIFPVYPSIIPWLLYPLVFFTITYILPLLFHRYIFSNSFYRATYNQKVHWIQHNPSRPWSIFDSPQKLYIIIYHLFSCLFVYMFLLTIAFLQRNPWDIPWSPDQTSVVASAPSLNQQGTRGRSSLGGRIDGCILHWQHSPGESPDRPRTPAVFGCLGMTGVAMSCPIFGMFLGNWDDF